MARSCTTDAPFLRSQSSRACAALAGGVPARRHESHSGTIRVALGRDGEKCSGIKPLAMIAEIPESFATLANRSGKFAQVLEPLRSSPRFGSDSRGEDFFVRMASGERAGWYGEVYSRDSGVSS
jgi:hypothetical protein